MLPTAKPDPQIIGITGRAHSGKDTAANHLVREYGFVSASFAGTLREMAEVFLTQGFGADPSYLHEPALKNVPIPEVGASARRIMQTLGTEWGRNRIASDVWIRSLEQRIGITGNAPVHDRIVITDVRFHNEAEWILAKGGHIVRLVREQAQAVEAHESESYADTLPSSTTLVNNGPTVYGLHALLDGTMASLGLERRFPAAWGA